MTVKHPTASVFVFGRLAEDWRIGLVEHPRLGRLVIPGGHVEDFETPAAAALREVAEETGLKARLIEPPGVLPLPFGCVHVAMPAPWWTVELPTHGDNQLGAAHAHVDHQFVAVADDPYPAGQPEHVFSWRAADEIAGLGLFHDTALQASALFERLTQSKSTAL